MSNWNQVTEPRQGIMLHYDDSASDAGAVEWLTRDPRCHVSYNILVLDVEKIVVVAPEDARAWHAGICRSSDPTRLPYKDANSAFWGVAIAARAGEVATPQQMGVVAALCRKFLLELKVNPLANTWRIVGHDSEAFPRGRKIDPTGPDLHHPVMSVQAIRGMVASGPPVAS